MGILINANLAADALADYEPGKQGLLDNEVVLCKAAEGNVHILVALREHIHGALVVPVVLVPVDGGGAEGLIGAVVVFDTIPASSMITRPSSTITFPISSFGSSW